MTQKQTPQSGTTPTPHSLQHMDQQRIETCGYESYHLRAGLPLRAGASLVDLCWIFSLSILFLMIFGLSIFSAWAVLVVTVVTAVLYWVPQKRLTGRTLGQRLWYLRPHENGAYRALEPLFQRPKTPFGEKVTALLLTVSQLAGAGYLCRLSLLRHPYLAHGSSWTLEAFVPPPEDWVILPFFYAIGGWPKKFRDHSVYYGLPYEAGPPTRFVGHVTAYWENPEIRVVLEGPKTPASGEPLAEVKRCIAAPSVDLHCLKTREAVLARHVSEMRNELRKNLARSWSGREEPIWSLKWFSVNHSQGEVTSEGELTQGIYLSARAGNRNQDRFILINQSGTHQALILNRPLTAQGEGAFELFEKTVRSLRTFSDLNPGKAWVDREISQIQLDELKAANDPSRALQTLIQVQAHLISKITVDPASFDSFFHLAGTSNLLAKNQEYHKNAVGVSALQNLHSAYRFAMDLSPTDPRTRQIEDLYLESRRHSKN